MNIFNLRFPAERLADIKCPSIDKIEERLKSEFDGQEGIAILSVEGIRDVSTPTLPALLTVVQTTDVANEFISEDDLYAKIMGSINRILCEW